MQRKLKPVVAADLASAAAHVKRIVDRLEKGGTVDLTSLRTAASQAHSLGRELDNIIGALDAERPFERRLKE